MPDGDGNGGMSREELRRQAERAVENGRAIEKITSLLEDNYSLREDRRRLRSENEELEDALEGVPESVREGEVGDDVVVLESDEAIEAFEAYTELGDPEEIEEELEAGRKAREKLSGLERREAVRDAAEAHGMNAGPLERLVDQDGLEIEVEERENDEGETEKRALVRPADEEDAESKPLSEYASEEWGEFKPALLGESGGETDGESDEGGTEWPDQPGETSPTSGEPSTDEIKERKKKSAPYKL